MSYSPVWGPALESFSYGFPIPLFGILRWSHNAGLHLAARATEAADLHGEGAGGLECPPRRKSKIGAKSKK